MDLRIAGALALLFTLSGCDLEEGWLQWGEQDESRLTLAITDAPVDDAAEVVVLITGVELQNSAGDWERLDVSSPEAIDLLETQGNREVLFDEVSVEAGNYQFIRLIIDETESYVMDSEGGQYPLFLDDEDALFGASADFTVPDDGTLDLTIDIDLRRSLSRTGDSFFLQPQMRIVETSETGTIAGTVDNALVTSPTCLNGVNMDIGNTVYVFEGSSATLDDIGGADGPVTTAPVRLGASGYTYRASYLPAGAYTLAFTCRASEDDPLVDDAVESATFADPVNVTVTAGSTTTSDLVP